MKKGLMSAGPTRGDDSSVEWLEKKLSSVIQQTGNLLMLQQKASYPFHKSGLDYTKWGNKAKIKTKQRDR